MVNLEIWDLVALPYLHRQLVPVGLDLRCSRDYDSDLVISFAIGSEDVSRIVAETSSPYTFLSGLWTCPDHRRHGLARALMAVVLAETDRRGVKTRLRINRFGEGGPGFPELEKFYCSLGFVPVPGDDLDGVPWERQPIGALPDGAPP
jgi:GNAT superfamily N-acetyltransferase